MHFLLGFLPARQKSVPASQHAPAFGHSVFRNLLAGLRRSPSRPSSAGPSKSGFRRYTDLSALPHRVPAVWLASSAWFLSIVPPSGHCLSRRIKDTWTKNGFQYSVPVPLNLL